MSAMMTELISTAARIASCAVGIPATQEEAESPKISLLDRLMVATFLSALVWRYSDWVMTRVPVNGSAMYAYCVMAFWAVVLMWRMNWTSSIEVKRKQEIETRVSRLEDVCYDACTDCRPGSHSMFHSGDRSHFRD